MMTRVEMTTFGAAALAVVRRVVTAAKKLDVLAPVTVLVPNNVAGMVVRRFLAGGLADGHAGVAGVYIATLPRLAEQLAAGSLAPRTPATPSIIAAAWRAALDADAGVFEAVQDHPATIRALIAAHRELRDVSESGLADIRRSGTLHESLVDLYRRAWARVSQHWYDQVDLLNSAGGRLSAAPGLARPLGQVVWYVPEALSNAESRFAAILAEQCELTVVAGRTGDDRADAALMRTLGPIAAGAFASSVATPQATRIIHTSDSDDEVRRIVRDVTAAIETTPAHRIAVLYSRAVPYARLLHEQFTSAGIAFNGQGTRAVAERALARGLLGLLGLAEDLPRAEFFRVLAEAPTRTRDDSPVPVSRWERISRLAGITRGQDWQTRLDLFVETQRMEILRSRDPEEVRVGRMENAERQLESARELRQFVDDLIRTLAVGRSSTTWSGLSSWSLELFHGLYGREDQLSRLPPEEQYAAAIIERILRGLAGLDGFGIAADLEKLRDLLLLELESSLPRVGRFGEGVFVGPVSSAIGLDADLVIVAGLAEDVYPGRLRENALLGADVRRRCPELRAPHDQLQAQHRALLAAFGAAPEVVATFPRGDLRRSTARLPSRWLLPSLRNLAGRTDLVAIDWEKVSAGGIISVKSYAAELTATRRPATEQEWRTRAIVAGLTTSDPIILAARELLTARASDEFTRFDGNLAGAVGLPDYGSGVERVSPTTLESYAVCPHSFFVRRLLRVEPVELPEEIITISPIDVGNLIHESMDQFIQAERDSLPSYGEAWTDRQQSRLMDIAAERALDYQARGATGHRLLWERERLAILTDLREMLRDDNKWRGQIDARVVASELHFGRNGADPVAVAIPPRRRVLMIGSADKVDETRNGVLWVTDIKTGSKSRYDKMDKDSVVGGTKLQLPVYAHAARQLLKGDTVRAQYWFVRKDRGERIPLALDEHLETRYAETVGILVSGIAGGQFPAKAPESPDFRWILCMYCNPDGLGHGEARERWERKRHDPRLTSLVALIDAESVEPAATE